MEGPTKVCRSCKRGLLFSLFSPCKKGIFGLHSQCKECRNAYRKQYRRSNSEKVREIQRRYNKTHHEEIREKMKRWIAANPSHYTEHSRKFRKRHPERNRVYQATWNAISRGKLKRPAQCEACGQLGKVQAHHWDYSRPLDVQWLCMPCHRKADEERRANEQAVATKGTWPMPIRICTCCRPDCGTCFPKVDFTAEELAEAERELAEVRPEDRIPFSEEKIKRMVADVLEADRKMKEIRESN